MIYMEVCFFICKVGLVVVFIYFKEILRELVRKGKTILNLLILICLLFLLLL